MTLDPLQFAVGDDPPVIRRVALEDELTGLFLLPDCQMSILNAGRGLGIHLTAQSALQIAAELIQLAGAEIDQ